MAIITETTRIANPRKVTRARKGTTATTRARTRTGQFKKAGRKSPSAGTHRRRVTRRATTTSRSRTTVRRNPGPLVYTLGLINPRPARKRRSPVSRTKKGSTHMARTSRRRRGSSTRSASGRFVSRRRRNPSRAAAPVRRRRRRAVVTYRRRRTRRNPAPVYRVRRRRTVRVMRRRRNPSVYGSRIGSPGSFKMVLGGLLGIAAVKVAAKFVPVSFRMGGGIGDTLITGGLAVGIGMLATKFLGAPMGDALMFGGLMYAGSILLNTFVPGFRVMDVPLALSGLGDFSPARFAVPQNPISAGMQLAAPAAPAGGVSGFHTGGGRLP